MNEIGKILIGLALILVLVGCNKEDNIHEKISEHLEATVEIEKTFEEHQQKIIDLEKEDEKLYNEIISLGSDDYEKVVTLAEEAITKLDERYEEVKLEKQSLEESKKEFEKIKPLMENITEEDELEQVEKMYDTMMSRYEAYNKVYDSYSESIQMTKELYTLFKEEQFDENKVYSLLTTVNDLYEEVLEANEEFNMKTTLYNKLKQEYYESLKE